MAPLSSYLELDLEPMRALVSFATAPHAEAISRMATYFAAFFTDFCYHCCRRSEMQAIFQALPSQLGGLAMAAGLSAMAYGLFHIGNGLDKAGQHVITAADKVATAVDNSGQHVITAADKVATAVDKAGQHVITAADKVATAVDNAAFKTGWVLAACAICAALCIAFLPKVMALQATSKKEQLPSVDQKPLPDASLTNGVGGSH